MSLFKSSKSKSSDEPVLHDCRAMSSLAFVPRDGGLTATVYAHEGRKPKAGEYLFFNGEKGMALYRCLEVDPCMNVDPPNMWLAKVEFVSGQEARELNLPAPPG